MLIESIILRKGGTFASIGGKEYHFAPREEDGPHVCEVTDPAHIERFLSVTEGYRAAGKVEAPKPEPIFKAAVTPKPAPAPVLEPVEADTDESGEDDLPLEAMTLTDLRALHEAETGAKPHGRAGRGKIIADILAHREKG